MNEQSAVALANLLSVLIPLGVKTYSSIQSAYSDKVKPLSEILDAADQNWQGVLDVANAEMAKLNLPPDPPPSV
jgi:hypothetical protein